MCKYVHIPRPISVGLLWPPGVGRTDPVFFFFYFFPMAVARKRKNKGRGVASKVHRVDWTGLD